MTDSREDLTPAELERALEDARGGLELAEKATKGPLDIYRQPVASRQQAMSELWALLLGTEMHSTLFMLTDGQKCPALTGCGPTSEANAEFIKFAWNTFPNIARHLLSQAEEIDRQRREIYRQVTSKEKAESRAATLADQVRRMRGALDEVMVGGNHLANVLITILGPGFPDFWPPYTEPEVARESLGTPEYDVWCCWAAIMRARAALLESAPQKQGE